MIDKLHIKNFLAFPELEVPELKLINLVAGKNGAGKTALLEAMRLDYDDSKEEVLDEIVASRKIDAAEIFHFDHLKNKRNEAKFNKLLAEQVSHKDVDFYLENEKGESSRYVPVPFGELNSVYISPRSNYSALSKIWNEIALTSQEVEVLEIFNSAMGLDVFRISILDKEVKVLLRGKNKPVQIETLGDGAKRVLLIAMSLTSSKKNLLLIDEIETHLHHSVIRKLWKIIFEYAIKWNIQVVATTHSQDAIREFWYEAAEQEDYQEKSQVLRLQVSREGKHEVIQFPFDLLDSVMEMKMEIR